MKSKGNIQYSSYTIRYIPNTAYLENTLPEQFCTLIHTSLFIHLLKCYRFTKQYDLTSKFNRTVKLSILWAEVWTKQLPQINLIGHINFQTSAYNSGDFRRGSFMLCLKTAYRSLLTTRPISVTNVLVNTSLSIPDIYSTS